MRFEFRSLLLASAALAAFSSSAFAATKADDTSAKIDALQRSVTDLENQLQELKQAQAAAQTANDSSAALADLKRSTSAQYDDVNQQLAAAAKDKPKLTIDNGRLSYTSPDSRFSIALRSLIQFDVGYFAQRRGAASVDLNSGTNFRRAQFGAQGTLFQDWSYNFLYDFGGNGVENRGYIYNAYLEYDGLKPFYIRAGAYTPAEGLEDQTGSGDLFFVERASAVDVARNIAGAPSREAISIFAQDSNYLISVSYTGKKTTDGTSTGASVGTFDAQQALIGRAAWLAVSTTDFKWLLDGHITDVLKLADTTASPSATVIRLSNGPELGVDASRTIDTGNLDADGVREFGFESAATYGPIFGQAGWFRYEVDRRLALPNPHFSGWYGFLTYSLTGEQHPYDPATASFRNIRPAHPVGTQGGLGAWEVTARYSVADLNFSPLASVATGGVPGGQQDVWTLGLNWYPNNAVKIQLNYDNIQVNHVNAPATDISSDAFVLRTQFAL